MSEAPLACRTHNHDHCVSDALAAARNLCAERGVRLTPLREQVLELIWQSHKPLGAYPLMDMLAAATTRQIAPPTVYRALDFLLEQRLIHRIHGLNAYIGCPDPQHQHQGHFLLCRHCGVAVELGLGNLQDAIEKNARSLGFTAETHSLEVTGLCPDCRKSDA